MIPVEPDPGNSGAGRNEHLILLNTRAVFPETALFFIGEGKSK